MPYYNYDNDAPSNEYYCLKAIEHQNEIRNAELFEIGKLISGNDGPSDQVFTDNNCPEDVLKHVHHNDERIHDDRMSHESK